MYVAVKGGEAAIAAAHTLLAKERRGDPAVPELTTDQIREQLALAVDRVMSEGSLYDRDLAALAIKQARGDLIEAIFLVRAYRSTLPRFGYAQPIDTSAMAIRRELDSQDGVINLKGLLTEMQERPHVLNRGHFMAPLNRYDVLIRDRRRATRTFDKLRPGK